nr:laccase-14-like [Ipomoea batatas]
MSLVMIKVLVLQVIGLLLLGSLQFSHARVQRHTFIVEETPYTRLCSSKKILTVNGSFPGPTLFAKRGDTIIVDVINNGNENITIHWHGVKQPRYPWSDGPEFITQCPIQPGGKFSQKIFLSDEEGTLWWHAHSDWSRATVHGQIVVSPPNGPNGYPFPKPQVEVPIILGEWWKSDIQEVLNEFLASGGDPNISDAFLINGQPGDRYNCSKNDIFRLRVDSGKTYLLRMVNAVMNNIMFFSIANHSLTVVGTDGAYTKPFQAPVVAISPGQTLDLLLHADQTPNHYYMAAKALNTADRVRYDNTTTTAFVQYSGKYTPSQSPPFPNLPDHNDINASVGFTSQLRSLADKKHPIDVPQNVSTNLFFTISINTRPCERNNTLNCTGPGGRMFAASVNNNSYILPQTDILEAYYYSTILNRSVNDVYATDFPPFPPFPFDYTNATLPSELQLPERNKTAKVFVLEYGTTVELVYQGTNLVAGIDHPMHLHGYSFYVVGWGFGNFDKDKDPQNYNLVDPPLMNTIALPKNAWTAIRFKADNPGVWFMHCHLERHISWGMGMTFIVKNGTGLKETMLPPPPDMPKC